jgi:hypothetical protein
MVRVSTDGVRRRQRDLADIPANVVASETRTSREWYSRDPRDEQAIVGGHGTAA